MVLLAGMLCGAPRCDAALAAAPEAEPVPSDAELEASGARIGVIEIDRQQIFNLQDPREDNWLYSLADHLHKHTRESAIRARLLIRTGQLYSRSMLEETARVLRSSAPYVREPEIRPVRYHDGVVDIGIVTHDVWTLSPAFNFGRSGGTNSTNFNVSDANLFGFGKSGEVGHSTSVDRNSSFASWFDPNVWGSRWQDGVQYANNSDGKVWSIMAGRPFYSLETPYAFGGTTGDNRGIVTRYSLGLTYDAFAQDERVTDLYVGKALLVDERWTVRALLGWRRDDSQFTPASNKALLGPLPADRNLAYPYARVQWIENDFATTHNLNQIAFTEDLHYGLSANLGLGLANPAFGADRRAVLIDGSFAHGWQFGGGQNLFVAGSAAGRLSSGQLQDAIASGSVSYYLTTSEQTKFVIKLSADEGHALDLDHFLQLGGDSGLRGYPLRYQSGSGRGLLSVEERVYTPWFPWRLVHVGGAVFFDAGRTWGSAPIPTPYLGLLKDFGAGLRLGNARSSFGNVIHIDAAVPMDAQANISRVQFLVSTEKTY
jgi:outer membrane protein assembly factor BamA